MTPRLVRASRLSAFTIAAVIACGAATPASAVADHLFVGQQHDSAIASDSFNRANQSPLAGNWTSSNLMLISNHVAPTSLASNGDAYYAAISWPSDQYSKAALFVTGTGGGDQGMGLVVRRSATATTYYRVSVDHASSNNVGVSKRVAGTYTNLATFTQSWSDGDTWELRVAGTTLQVFRNGSQVGTDVTDCSIASGAAGLAYSSTETAATLDNWEGGAAVTPGPTWLHEPPGLFVFKNTNFTAFPNDGWISEGGTVVTDSTAPLSPTHQVIQWVYDSTLVSGNSPGMVYTYDFTPNIPIPTYFVGLYFKLSNPFDLPINGVAFWNPNYLLFGVRQDSTVSVEVFAPGGSYNLYGNVSDPKITLGAWHKFEHYFRPASSPTAHDGIIRWWIDGVLCGDYTDVGWSGTTEWAWVYWPGWDGVEGSHPAYTSYLWVDHTYLSRPVGGMRAWDNFNRPNETPLAGNWTSIFSGMNLDSNRVVPADFGGDDKYAYYTGMTWPDDQYSRAKLYVPFGAVGGGNGPGVVVRNVRRNPVLGRTQYRLTVDHASSDNVTIERYIADTDSTLATFTKSWTDGDTWELRVTGATLQAFRNDSQVGTDVIDSAVIAGDPGLVYSTDDSTAAMDDWEGGGIVRDSFNRADQAPLAGNWTSTGLNLTSNHVVPASLATNGQAAYTTMSWPTAQYSRAHVCVDGTAGGDQGMGLLVRKSPTAVTYYRLSVDHKTSNNVGVSKRVAGGYTSLATFTQSWTNGDLWELRATGPTLQVFRNGTQVGTDLTDSAIVSGAAGLAYSSTETAAALDNWEGGAIASGIPPYPEEPVAPPLDSTVFSSLYTATTFLYTGPNPVQTGVSDTTIQPLRTAVLRGKVYTRAGAPLPGATVTVLNHPEFGQTISRATGQYDLVVNGGGALTLTYADSGYLPAQRHVTTPWQDYVAVPDVMLVSLDTLVTVIAADSDSVQVARGSVVSDTDGTRQATVLLPANTTAEMHLASGDSSALSTLHLRATEYTVGPNGPSAMPGELPFASAYTYAVDLSADEAIAAGATSVAFNQPTFLYLENFLHFPVGISAPVGSYHSTVGAWFPSRNGRVIKILSTSGGIASVDVAGDSVAADSATLAGLGFTDLERRRLAVTYSAGQELWRAPITHLSPWDVNNPDSLPSNATKPTPPDSVSGGGAGGGGTGGKHKKTDQPCPQSGSIIDCENQVLGERLPIVGTPYSLNYRSSRRTGSITANRVVIPLSGPSVPASLVKIRLRIVVAGRIIDDSFPGTANQQTVFEWDGTDAYGRAVSGAQPLTAIIGYVYTGGYRTPAPGDTSFGLPGGTGLDVTTRYQNTLKLYQQTLVGTWDARATGLGGWTLDVQHAYDPIARVLYLGDGSQRTTQTLGQTIRSVGGTVSCSFGGDSGPATAAALCGPNGITVAPDGSVYIADSFNQRVRRIGPDGVIHTVAGNGTEGSTGDGGPATSAELNIPGHVVVAPDGSFYISEYSGNKVRRVGTDGVITTVAGTGTEGSTGDGGPATSAELNGPFGLALGLDGSLYITENVGNRIRRVGPDGVIVTVAGTGAAGFNGDSIPAVQAKLNVPASVTVGPDGLLYLADDGNNRVRRISAEGIITTVAGTGTFGYSGDGGPATAAKLFAPFWVAFGNDGAMFIADFTNERVRRVGTDGIIVTYAGNGAYTLSGDGGTPLQAALDPGTIAVAPNGDLYVGDVFNSRIRVITPTLPGVALGDILLPADDGAEIYRFDYEGRHLETLDALTGSTRYAFAYDSTGVLATVTDRSANVTTVVHTSGMPTAIVTPFGHQTALAADTNGFLMSVTNPAGEVVQLHDSANGLLTTETDPRGGVSRFGYDSLARLVSDEDAATATTTLATTETDSGYTVAFTTALGRGTAYGVVALASGATRRTVVDPAGLTSSTTINPDGSSTTSAPNGTVTHSRPGPDPRFGVGAPILDSVTVRMPSSLQSVRVSTRHDSLSDPTNPLSLVSQTDSVIVNGHASVSRFTIANRRLVLTSPVGRQLVTDLDSLGRVASFSWGGLDSITFAFDSRGRLSEQSQGGRILTYAYDSSTGRLQSVIDPLGRLTELAYDSAGRLIQRTRPNSSAILFGYDSAGNLVRLTPPGDSAHGFQYTLVNLTKEYDPPGIPGLKATKYFTDLDRQLDSIMRPDSITVSIGYDTAGRPAAVTFDRGTLTFAYSATTGNLTGVRTPAGDSLLLGYDGALFTEARWTGSVQGTVSVGRNTDFRVTSQVVDGDTVTFVYDADGLLTGAGALKLGRSATNGLVMADTLGPVRSAYQYTTRGELAQYRVRYDTTSIFATDLGRDSAGQLVQRVDTIQGMAARWSYVYDSTGRLVQDSLNGSVFHVFTYDANGNRLSMISAGDTITSAYDAQDRLIRAVNGPDTTRYAYGSNGELKTKTVSVGATAYTYDALGNLVIILLPDSTAISYAIDGQNRRVGRKVNGRLIQGWLYQDQVNPVAEIDSSGDVVSRFVYGSRANVPDYMIKGDTVYRLVTDHLGSVRLVVDTASGAVAQRLDYDEWGNVTVNTSPGFQPFGFAGGLFDDSTNLIHFGARDYDPAVGRWTIKDPILFKSGETGLYVYANDNPASLVDPSGLQMSETGSSYANCPKSPGPSALKCIASAVSLGANLVTSGLVLIGGGEIALGVLGGEAAVFTTAVVGGDADAALISSSALVAQGATHVAQGALVGPLTYIGAGADVVSGNFSWWKSFIPLVGLPADITAFTANCLQQ